MSEDRTRLAEATNALREAVGQVIVGQDAVVEEVLICLFAGGHVLLEGAPGLGKTLLVRTLARAMELEFSRIQFTPDLMPSDITGTRLVVDEPGVGKRFTLEKGPLFGQLVLADEINRATPKTQSALLEAMAEGAVTIAGERHVLAPPFVVLATENPIEMEGTYPLPEAQLDRFLFKVLVPAPDEDTLVAILDRTTGNAAPEVPVVLDGPRILALRALVRDVVVAEPLARYVARFVRASDPTASDAVDVARARLRFGAGVRGAQSWLLAAKAAALMAGRGHVGFEDLLRVRNPALRHRILPSFEAEADGIAPDAILDELAAAIPETPPSLASVG
ncbi:MAG: AAA family ATPase [Myxococcota bacterium]